MKHPFQRSLADPSSVSTPCTLTTPQASRPSGCYGFRLAGLDGGRALLVDAPAEWPLLDVRQVAASGTGPAVDRVGADRAELPLHDGWMTVDRSPARVVFRLHALRPAADLIHPYLAPAAALVARWAGLESFHAGAFVAGGGAWIVLGDKEDGKSTMLAQLALEGCQVLTDDLAVVDHGCVLAGPRCIDLREPAAAQLGVGEPLGVVGIRERWRLRLDPAVARVPLRGWVRLAWDDEVGVDEVRGAERMLALMPFRSVRLTPEEPRALIDLGSLPMLRLRRPRRWDALREAGRRLVGAIAG
jgi:hypothetical protein